MIAAPYPARHGIHLVARDCTPKPVEGEDPLAGPRCVAYALLSQLVLAAVVAAAYRAFHQ